MPIKASTKMKVIMKTEGTLLKRIAVSVKLYIINVIF